VWRIGVILLLIWVPALAQTSDPVVRCPRVPTPPRIDGRADDSAWEGVEPHTIDSREQIHPNYRELWGGPDDLSARVRAVRTRTDLYLLFEVRDDVLMHEPGKAFWVGDSIELFLDTDRETDPEDARYSDDDRQLFLMPFHSGVSWSVVSRGPGLPYPSGGLSGLELAHTRQEGGYTLELRIPLATLHPLRSDADGQIGFDVALNDVDAPNAKSTHTYMTLSGRQELYGDPTRFARLRIGSAPATASESTDPSPALFPFGPSQLLWGLVAVAALSFLVRAAARKLPVGGRRSLLVLCGISAFAAALLGFVPAAANFVDERGAPDRWRSELDAVEAAVQGCLDLDSGPPDRRATRLLWLVRQGGVRTRPRYHYELLPLTPTEQRRHPRYGIALDPGETRVFPLQGLPAPTAIEAVLKWRETMLRNAGGEAVARTTLEFAEGPPLTAEAGRSDANPLRMALGSRAGQPMLALHVTNALSYQPLILDTLYGIDETGTRFPLPLAARTPRGTPLDIWHDRPASHIVTVRNGESSSIAVNGLSGHRLWLAGRPIGAYPDTPYGTDAVRIRVYYKGGSAGSGLVLRNGIDLKEAALLFALPEAERSRIALEWTRASSVPGAFLIHSLALDPEREVERIEIVEEGVLSAYRLAAATLGRRETAAPSLDSGLVLRGERLSVRPEVREGWDQLSFAVRAPDGGSFGEMPGTGVETRITLRFGPEAEGTLRVELPRANWARAIHSRRDVFLGLAAFGLAFATVLGGAALLARARQLRVKMLAAVGTAALVPLLFLVIALTAQLNEAAETELESVTRDAQRGLRERVLRWRARVGERATLLRDTVEPVRLRGGAPLATLLRRQRESARSEGLRLRIPGLAFEPDSESVDDAPFANANIIDATRYSGILESPWDGVMAIGVARAPGRRRYLVAAPAPVLLGRATSPDVVSVLYGTGGSALASTRGNPIELNTTARRASIALIEEELRQSGEDHYEPVTHLLGERWAASFSLLNDAGKPVGVLAVYRSRGATEDAKATVLRTLLFAGLAALLLVVLAGSMLVEGITTRIRGVMRAARALARGDLESRVPVEAEDEVSQLARSFNAMADALDNRVGQLSQLHQGLQELARALDRDEAARIAAGCLERASGAMHIVVAAYDRTTERFETLYRHGDPAPLGAQLPDTGPERRAITERKPIRAEGGVFLPLLTADRVVGLAVCSPVSEAVELEFLDAGARQIGIALENARLYRAATIDDLTGLYTMGLLRRRIGEEVDLAAEAGRPLSLVRIVVSNHAAIARAHGPQAAARVVAESADILVRELPTRAVAARHESADLIALLPESDHADAQARLDRVRSALNEQRFAWLHGIHPPTFQHGTVSYPASGSSAQILLDRLLESAAAGVPAPAIGQPAVRVPEHLAIVLGGSPPMRAAFDLIARVSPTTATVLINGETGVGKEIAADLIQANSRRADGPYIKLNCAAIPETLIETELFGHEKGAFTGADRRRIGQFEEAHGGTLFLDEIGELPLALQVRLLRVLQERRFTRVGGAEPIDVDVRIIAATNRDLQAAVRDGEFREDLYHRLHVIELTMPALRDRREDLPELIEQFRKEFNRRHGLGVGAFRPDALDALYEYAWPGNVRELRNVIERAMLFAAGEEVERRHLALPDDGSQADSARLAKARASLRGLTPRQERILDRARTSGGLTNRDVVEAEDVSARTALRELQALVERGLLSRVGRRRGAVYKPVDTLDA